MKRILTSAVIVLMSLNAIGQTVTNKRVMLDSLNNKISWGTPDIGAMEYGKYIMKSGGKTFR